MELPSGITVTILLFRCKYSFSSSLDRGRRGADLFTHSPRQRCLSSAVRSRLVGLGVYIIVCCLASFFSGGLIISCMYHATQSSACCLTYSYVLCSLHGMRRNLLKHFVSNACTSLSVSAVRVQLGLEADSAPYSSRWCYVLT